MNFFHNIDMVESRLREWVSGTSTAGTSFGLPPKEPAEKEQVHFYLLDLLNKPRPHVGTKRPAAQIVLRYLAMVTSPESGKEGRLACELLFDAMDNLDIETETDPVPISLWSALGIPPQPGFIFRIGVVRLRDQVDAPIVRKIVVRSSPIVGMNGTVLGPGALPLVNAVVEMPTLKTSVRTDEAGRFNFPAVPPEPPEVELVVKARGKEMSVRTAAHREPDSLVVINFNLLEK